MIVDLILTVFTEITYFLHIDSWAEWSMEKQRDRKFKKDQEPKG